MEISSLFSPAAIVIALAVMVMLRLVKGGIEAWRPELLQRTWMKKLVLPASAVAAGSLFGLASMLVPVGLESTLFNRALYGAVVGGMSTLFWRAAKALLPSKEKDDG